jgi:hypothetical protein
LVTQVSEEGPPLDPLQVQVQLVPVFTSGVLPKEVAHKFEVGIVAEFEPLSAEPH